MGAGGSTSSSGIICNTWRENDPAQVDKEPRLYTTVSVSRTLLNPETENERCDAEAVHAISAKEEHANLPPSSSSLPAHQLTILNRWYATRWTRRW